MDDSSVASQAFSAATVPLLPIPCFDPRAGSYSAARGCRQLREACLAISMLGPSPPQHRPEVRANTPSACLARSSQARCSIQPGFCLTYVFVHCAPEHFSCLQTATDCLAPTCSVRRSLSAAFFL